MMFFRVKKVKKKCVVCGCEFTAREAAKYCSNKCRERAYRERLERSKDGNAGTRHADSIERQAVV
jgi:hypothetical protein